MLKVSEVAKYIERLYNIKLLDIQKDFLKHVIAGDTIYTPRCFGRSMIYNGYADYLKNVVGKSTNYSIDPVDFDKVYTYEDVPLKTFYPSDIERFKSENEEAFNREYECGEKNTFDYGKDMKEFFKRK